jgi:hypothetical protein
MHVATAVASSTCCWFGGMSCQEGFAGAVCGMQVVAMRSAQHLCAAVEWLLVKWLRALSGQSILLFLWDADVIARLACVQL